MRSPCNFSSGFAMLDQVRFLKSLGISAEIIGDEQNCEHARKRVERGQCQIVYG